MLRVEMYRRLLFVDMVGPFPVKENALCEVCSSHNLECQT